jgi:hypothetical protein
MSDTPREWFLQYVESQDPCKSNTEISGPPLNPGEHLFVVDRAAFEKKCKEVELYLADYKQMSRENAKLRAALEEIIPLAVRPRSGSRQKIQEIAYGALK